MYSQHITDSLIFSFNTHIRLNGCISHDFLSLLVHSFNKLPHFYCLPHHAEALKHSSQRPWGTLRCIIVPGKAIYQTILPLCRVRVPTLLPSKDYWVWTSGRKRGGGLLTDLWPAAINLGDIPVLQWTRLHRA